jgi:hypothetical protein
MQAASSQCSRRGMASPGPDKNRASVVRLHRRTPMTARTKPHARKKAARRVLSPDYLWAARITKRILADEHPWQLAGTIDPSRRVSFCVGRGGAKTTTKRARALIKALWLRNQYIGYAATSKEHARLLNWDKLKLAAENYGIRMSGDDPDVTFLEASMRMTCHRTGTVYQLRGVEDTADAEKFRGFPQTEFQVDECGSFKPEVFEYLLTQCVSPRLGEALALPAGLLEFIAEWDEEDEDALEAFLEPIDWDECRGGCLVLGSTPPRRIGGEFYEVTREGSKRHRPYAKRHDPEFRDWLGYSSHNWTLKDVVDLPDSKKLYPALWYNWQEALREKAEKGWSDDNPIWKREYLGIWAADDTDTVFRYRPHVDGKPWNQWDPIGRPAMTAADLAAVVKILRADFADLRFVVQLDEGFKDPFACNVFAFSPSDVERRIWHVFAFERTEFYAKLIAQLLLGEDAVTSMMSAGVMPQKLGGIFGAIGGWPDGVGIDGDDTTIAEMANVYGIRMVKSDRKPDAKIGRIELVNGDLVDGRIKILKDSPLEKQILVLQWKEDDFGHRKEDKAQANHCLIAGTMVMTEHGERPIETVRAGDLVWTRRGLRPVLWSGHTGERATRRVVLSNGRDLIGTADHKIWTGDGWKSLALLTDSDTLTAWESTDRASLSYSEGRSIADIQRARTLQWLGTSLRQTESSFTEQSGRRSAGQSRQASTFTTRTGITPTTGSPTSRSSAQASTTPCTPASPHEQQSPGPRFSSMHYLPPLSGIDPPRVEHGTPKTLVRVGRDGRAPTSRASSAELSFSPSSLPEQGSAPRRVPRRLGELAEATIDRLRASSVLRSSCAIDSSRPDSVRPLVSIPTGRVESVYDLTVDGEHEFFANGILVHNSTDTLADGRKLIATLFESGAVVQEGKTKTPDTPVDYSDPMGLPGIGTDDQADENEGLLSPSEWNDDDDW